MAQGEQQRLAALGYPKQMVQVCGEPNIARTVRLLKTRVFPGTCDIALVARATAEWTALAASTGATLRTLSNTGDCILDGLRNSSHLWSKDAATLVILGDVVWTEAALQKVAQPPTPLMFLGRSGPNTVTGRPWPELFGLAFAPSAARRLLTLLADKEAQQAGAWLGENGKLWNLLRTLRATRQIPTAMIEIDDATDDVDVPEDVERLREHAAHFQ